jgi:hypothetical protein
VLIGGWLVATGGAGQAVDAAERRWLPLLGIALLQIVVVASSRRQARGGSMPTAAVLVARPAGDRGCSLDRPRGAGGTTRSASADLRRRRRRRR